jgi:methyl-accepting chemotaxis protein
MPKLDHETLDLLLILVTAICMLGQTIVLCAVFLAVRKGVKSLTEQVDDLRNSAMPVIDHTRDFVKRITPKVEETAKNVAEMSKTLKEQTTKVSASATEIAQRVNVQSTRVDAMVSNALDALDSAAGFVAETVNKPVRQLSGLLASIKAIVESLSASQPARPGSNAPQSASQRAYSEAEEYDPQSETML